MINIQKYIEVIQKILQLLDTIEEGIVTYRNKLMN